MNPAQTNLYRREWQTTAKVHGWNTKAGIAAALAAHHTGQVWESPALNALLAAIYEIAGNYAKLAGGGMTTNNLRHACTGAALRRHVSSKSFTNADLDKVLALLRVLANPTSLKNQNAFQSAGEQGERRRHLHVITNADAPYWQTIAKDKFGHADLDRLTLAQLRQMSLTIRNRRGLVAAPTTRELLAA
jgi:hypothetical protein